MEELELQLKLHEVNARLAMVASTRSILKREIDECKTRQDRIVALTPRPMDIPPPHIPEEPEPQPSVIREVWLDRYERIAKGLRGHEDLVERILQYEEILMPSSVRKIGILSRSESDLVSILLSRQGTVSRETIHTILWGALPDVDQPSEPRIVDVMICNIRRKLQQPDGGVIFEIETDHGEGFRIVPREKDKLRKYIQGNKQ